MENNFFKPNNPISYHVIAFFMTAIVMIVIGMLFIQISSCRTADYMYSSGRLDGAGHTGLMCKIF